MRLHVLTVALALGVGSWAPAQTTSSSSSPQQLSLPAAPRSPKSLAECDAYQKRLDDQMAQISQQHSACLESFKEDRQGDNNLICSRSECQNLHTLLYGPHKTAGEQQVASCQAAVQRYQARSAAQQQGIQTLGNAIGDLLAPTPSAPIDSQNDLASYEEQQKGQAVLGDDSTTSSSPDDAANNVMNSGVPDSGPSVQSQLDSATESALANDSTPTSTPNATPSQNFDTQGIPGHPYLKQCWYGPCPNDDALSPEEKRQKEIGDAIVESWGGGEGSWFTPIGSALDLGNDYLNNHYPGVLPRLWSQFASPSGPPPAPPMPMPPTSSSPPNTLPGPNPVPLPPPAATPSQTPRSQPAAPPMPVPPTQAFAPVTLPGPSPVPLPPPH